jgi:hypothetical protein
MAILCGAAKNSLRGTTSVKNIKFEERRRTLNESERKHEREGKLGHRRKL